MAQLYPSMFALAHDDAQTLAGLKNEQERPVGDSRRARNANWFNGAGEWLGWGDLSVTDLRDISASLDPDDVFIVVKGRHNPGNGMPRNPGVVDLANLASYVITTDCVRTTVRCGPTDQDYAFISVTDIRDLMAVKV